MDHYQPPINTTNVVAVEGQNQTTTERQRTQITYLTQPKNNPWTFTSQKETIAVNTERELREKKWGNHQRLGKHRRGLIREKGEKVQKTNTQKDNRYINGNQNPLLRFHQKKKKKKPT